MGKTTTAINLGTALAAVGEKVLLIDSDPQGNASTGLGVGRAQRRKHPLRRADGRKAGARRGGADLRAGPGPGRRPTRICPASSWSWASRPAARSSCATRSAPLRIGRDRYTYVLIDCPPSLNLLTVNAMAAADAVLVPLQCEFFALEGLTQLMRTIDLVRGSLNPSLEIQGVVLTMYDRRNSLSEQVAGDVRTHFGDNGLRDGDPAQRAGVRGAVVRQAGADLRSEMRRAARPI